MVTYIQHLIQNIPTMTQLWFLYFPFLSSWRKKIYWLAINSFSDSPCLHNCINTAPTMQTAKIVQWAMSIGSLSAFV